MVEGHLIFKAMNIRDELKKSKLRAINRADNDIEDGKKNVLAKATLEVDSYISFAIAMRSVFDKIYGEKVFDNAPRQLSETVPVILIARILQNLEKRRHGGSK
jgi:DNA polymerase III delta prime subunit